MTIQEVKDRWSPGMKDPQAAIDWWNSRAGAFASRDIPTAQSSLAIRLITEKQMIIIPIYFVRKELAFPTFFITFSICYTS